MHEKTNDWAQWTNEFDALQQLHKNCSSTFHGVMFLFIHTKIFSHFISKIGVNDWKYTICPGHDTNNSTSDTANLSIYEIKEVTSKGMISCSGN